MGAIVTALDALLNPEKKLSEEETKRLRETVKVEIQRLQTEMLQIQVSLEEAKHPSLFVAGARPAILWIFALGLAYNVVLHPLLEWAVAIAGLAIGFNPGADFRLPARFDYEELWPIIGGMLGLAGWRSFEKRSGVARERL
jgi:hypothetical protein